ncbi:hypothetical protein BRC97_00740 [Halobacteriales archaeon QS_6_71_20]|nr:MAG: hypothetical protein BRC97_00740 [Halobacteriales archaeon QS_6_71_20]
MSRRVLSTVWRDRGTDSPTPTATPPGGFPAGVDADGVDVDRVVDAHRAALSNGSWTVTLSRTVRGPDGVVERSRAAVRVDGARSLYAVERVRGDDRLSSVRWTDGSASASRRVDWKGTVTLDARPNDGGIRRGLDPTGSAWLAAAFLDTRPVYAGTDSTEAGVVTVVEAEAGRVERSGVPDRRNVRLRARIGETGVVRSLVLRYDTYLGDGRGSVRIVVRTLDRGSTTVPRPDWVDRALANATTSGTETTEPPTEAPRLMPGAPHLPM